MQDIFNDYVLYYQARMKRWENNPHYPNAYQSEKALYELISKCNSMDELQSKASEFQILTVQNAIALVKDQEIFRKNIYEECKEFVRAEAPSAILEKLDGMQTDMDIINMVNKVQQENTIHITIDELMAMFYTDFVTMENIEVYQQAIIPDEWKEQCKQYEKDIIESGKKLWLEKERPAARQWQPDWTLNYELLFEERHRRLIPVNDEELQKKITLHKMYKTA